MEKRSKRNHLLLLVFSGLVLLLGLLLRVIVWVLQKGLHLLQRLLWPRRATQDHQVDDVDYIDVKAEIIEGSPREGE